LLLTTQNEKNIEYFPRSDLVCFQSTRSCYNDGKNGEEKKTSLSSPYLVEDSFPTHTSLALDFFDFFIFT
jgi:hypothetical protein